MDSMERFNTIVRIVERAEAMGIDKGTRITRIMDMENADKQFALRLDDFLAADELDFCHDFNGIQCNMNRLTGRVENLFVPRFAGTPSGSREDQLSSVAQTVACMVNRFIREPITITYRKETKESLNDYTEWGRQRLGLFPGGEFFFISRGGELLYTVCVNADSVLTAAHELMALIAKKF